MAEIPRDSGPNYIPPGNDFNPHHESGNIGAGPSFMGDKSKMVRFQDLEPVGDPNMEAAMAANRSFFRTGESLSMEQIGSAETPKELFEGLRTVLEHLEDGNIPSALEDRYGATRIYGILYERSKLLKITPDELKAKGWITEYDASTGIGIPKNRKYAPLALAIEEIPVVYKDPKTKIKRVVGTDVVYKFGTEKQRKEMAVACEKAIHEFECRTILGEQVGMRLNPETRDGLENLVVYLRSGRMPKFKADHLQTLFNAPGVAELENNPENRELGDQIENAMFLNLIMLNSGTKQKMQDLLARPGSNFLITKMAKEHADKKGLGSSYGYKEWVLDNIGEVDKWTDDNLRELDTFISEAKKGYRKDLTKWSNIAASYPDDFGGDEETSFIEETMGRLVGSKEASWIAATMMRAIGAYASEGYVALPNGKSALQLGEDGYISSDDTGKFWAYMQVLKEGLKGRSSFLKDMIGKIPDMAMNLFDWSQVKVRLDDGTVVRRSIWDAWLGTAAGIPITDILTGEPTGKETKKEDYHRLGDLDFNSLRRDFHGKFATMQWLVGSGERPTGVLTEALRTDFKSEDFALNTLKKINKYVGIVFNPVTLTQGSMHRYDTSKIDILKRNFMRNMMKARIHSFSFTMGVLNSTKRMFDVTTSPEVPDPIWIMASIREVLRPNPRTEEELRKHYLDESKQIKGLSRSTNEVDSLLIEEFLPENKDEQLLVGYVGKVTGKKKP